MRKSRSDSSPIKPYQSERTPSSSQTPVVLPLNQIEVLDQMTSLLKRLKEQYQSKENVDKELLQEIMKGDFESVLMGFKEEIMSSKSNYSVVSHQTHNM